MSEHLLWQPSFGSLSPVESAARALGALGNILKQTDIMIAKGTLEGVPLVDAINANLADPFWPLVRTLAGYADRLGGELECFNGTLTERNYVSGFGPLVAEILGCAQALAVVLQAFGQQMIADARARDLASMALFADSARVDLCGRIVSLAPASAESPRS